MSSSESRTRFASISSTNSRVIYFPSHVKELESKWEGSRGILSEIVHGRRDVSSLPEYFKIASGTVGTCLGMLPTWDPALVSRLIQEDIGGFFFHVKEDEMNLELTRKIFRKIGWSSDTDERTGSDAG